MKVSNFITGLRICMMLSSAAWFQFVANFFHSSSVIINDNNNKNYDNISNAIPTTNPKEPLSSSLPTLPLPIKLSSSIAVFEPGTLKMEKKETISKCWTESPFQKDQRIQTEQHCLYSKKYKVLVNLSGKTGTSTQKKVLQSIMNAKEVRCSDILNDDRHEDHGEASSSSSWIQVATVREPMDRFVSGYKETLFREGVYTDNPDIEENEIPKKYSRFLSLLQNKSMAERESILRAETPEQLQLKTQMFEIFVQDYDGETIFDRHLNSQTIKLWDHKRGAVGMAKYDFIMEAANLTQDLVSLSDLVHAPRYPQEVRARSRTSDRLDLESLPDATIQKICRLFALDYCCLNYPLPPACQRAPPGQRVLCDWVAGAVNSGDVNRKNETTTKAPLQIRSILG